MPQFTLTRRLPYKAEHVFSIVEDVDAYPQFVPLVTAAKIWDREDLELGKTRFQAALDVAYPKLRIRETFVSSVTVNAPKLTVRAVGSTGPVKHLDNRWQIRRIGEDRCDVEFYLDYEMSSRMLQAVMSGAFDYATRKIMNAFEERARQLESGKVG